MLLAALTSAWLDSMITNEVFCPFTVSFSTWLSIFIAGFCATIPVSILAWACNPPATNPVATNRAATNRLATLTQSLLLCTMTISPSLGIQIEADPIVCLYFNHLAEIILLEQISQCPVCSAQPVTCWGCPLRVPGRLCQVN